MYKNIEELFNIISSTKKQTQKDLVWPNLCCVSWSNYVIRNVTFTKAESVVFRVVLPVGLMRKSRLLRLEFCLFSFIINQLNYHGQPLPLTQLILHFTVNNFVVVVLKLDLGAPMTADPRVGSGEVVGYLPLLDRG